MSRPNHTFGRARAPMGAEHGSWEHGELNSSSQHRVEASEGYHMIGMYQAALHEIRALPETDQAHPISLHLLSRIYHALGDIPRALEATDAFIQVQPGHPFGSIFEAMLFMSPGEPSKAYDLLTTVIPNFPGHATMHYDLARAAASCGFWTEARHWIYLAICSQASN